ncbi:MAG: DUF2378 family protein [Sandaracinaceae bacterium]
MRDAFQDRLPFVPPDYDAPLEVAERQAGCPDTSRVKGMFFSAIAQEARERSGDAVGRERYVAFHGYPLTEWLAFLPEAARAAYPELTEREGMRRFGQNAFSVFTNSLAGRVLFSMAGRNIRTAVGLTGRAFDAIGSHGGVDVLVNEPGRAVFGLREMWDYLDAWHVGIYEGALDAFGHVGEVRIRAFDIKNGDLEIRYGPR